MLTNGNEAYYGSEEMRQQMKYYLDTFHLLKALCSVVFMRRIALF